MSFRPAVQAARAQLVAAGPGRAPALVACDTYSQQSNRTEITLTSTYVDVSPVQPGAVLSVYDPTSAATAAVVFVSGMSGSTLYVIEGYNGAPETDLSGLLLEVNPPDSWTGRSLWRAAETIMDNHLWPHVWAWGTHTITAPDPVREYAEVPATVRAVERAWQEYSTDYLDEIEVILERNNPVSSTGTLVRYPFSIYYQTDIQLQTRRLYTEDDLSGSNPVSGLAQLVGTGAAALALDPSVVGEQIVSPAGERPVDVAPFLWRSFERQREAWTDRLRDEMRSTIAVQSFPMV